jgi:hypothetical protein
VEKPERGENLNANSIWFPSGDGAGEHVNERVDVVMVRIDGLGTAAVALSVDPGCGARFRNRGLDGYLLEMEVSTVCPS